MMSLRAAEYLQSSGQGRYVVPGADQREPALTLTCEIMLMSFDADLMSGFYPLDNGFAQGIYCVRVWRWSRHRRVLL